MRADRYLLSPAPLEAETDIEITAEVVRLARSGQFVTGAQLKAEIHTEFPQAPEALVTSSVKEACRLMMRQHMM